MKLEHIISGLALVISIIFGILAYKTSQKANRLQTEVLQLTLKATNFEIAKGEILIMSLLGRYFIGHKWS